MQKLHSSDTPQHCKKCGDSFPDRYHFKVHMKTHEGEKCFKCNLCDYAASSLRHLETHLLTHSGEKPHECDKCELAFRQKQLLRRHKALSHNAEYTPMDKEQDCVACARMYKSKKTDGKMEVENAESVAEKGESGTVSIGFIIWPGPEVIKLISCSTELKISTAHTSLNDKK